MGAELQADSARRLALRLAASRPNGSSPIGSQIAENTHPRAGFPHLYRWRGT